jgi:hypothetical protein
MVFNSLSHKKKCLQDIGMVDLDGNTGGRSQHDENDKQQSFWHGRGLEVWKDGKFHKQKKERVTA